LREVPKDVKIKYMLIHLLKAGGKGSENRGFLNFNKNFMGYQAVNESLQWLRNKTSGMVTMPHMIINPCDKDIYEMDNSQPSY